MRWAAKAMSSRRLGTDLSYHKELMLYLGKSIATRDGLSLLLGVEYPAIAATYTDTDKVFVLDKVFIAHKYLWAFTSTINRYR